MTTTPTLSPLRCFSPRGVLLAIHALLLLLYAVELAWHELRLHLS